MRGASSVLRSPAERYFELMKDVRLRIDHIRALESLRPDDPFACEQVALHGRRMIENIAFGCATIAEQAGFELPKSMRREYHAVRILRQLEANYDKPYPSPSIIRRPLAHDMVGPGGSAIAAVIEGVPAKRIPAIELEHMYNRLSDHLHGQNPLSGRSRITSDVNDYRILWEGLTRLIQFIERHVMTIRGVGYFCVLRDSIDGSVKLLPITKLSEIPFGTDG